MQKRFVKSQWPVLAPEREIRRVPAESVDEFSDQIGGKLRQAREAAALSVEDVIFQTRIPRAVITALEAGDFSFFTSPIYAKSFLAQYSNFLTVEAGLWLDALQPASFISGENVTQLWTGNPEPRPERLAKAGPAGGWKSALSMLIVTCGIVFAVIKGYEFFDKRLGADTPPTAEIPAPPPVTQSNSPVQPPESQVRRETSDREQAAPQAGVVR